MIKHSREWAAARGLVQKNEVHGDDEWRIPTMRGFKQVSRDKTVRRSSTSFMVQVCAHARTLAFCEDDTGELLQRMSPLDEALRAQRLGFERSLLFVTEGRAIWWWRRAATAPHRSANEDEDLANPADQSMPLQRLAKTQ